MLSVPAGLPRVFAGIPSEATVTILDRTEAEVYFDPDVYNVTEGQTANLRLRLTKDVDPSVTFIVFVRTMDGSATGAQKRHTHMTSIQYCSELLLEISANLNQHKENGMVCSSLHSFLSHCSWS